MSEFAGILTVVAILSLVWMNYDSPDNVDLPPWLW